ncbi:MAG: hypothetical protein H7175_18800, partial [Burkholderiales bacterium]|nr:hypothetical protein [Anaerolineae bacterium]
SVAFSPEGRTVLSGSRDGSMRLWNVETGGEIRRFEGHESAVYSVAFNPDGRTVLSGSGDNTLRLWEIESGEVLRRYDGHTDTVWSVAFASRGGGRTALSGSADGTMRLWRTETLGGLIAWTYENRYVPELTCAEREQYRVEPLCTITDNPNSAALDITEQPE